MTARGQWTVVVAVLALAGAAIYAGTRYLSSELFPVGAGSRAPQFAAATLDSPPKIRTLADYRGKVVLLNIWATYCGPCRVEMPSIEALHRSYVSKGLRVVAVSVDDSSSAQLVRDFVKQYGLTFQILYDPSGRTGQIYQTTGIPETIIIGRDGLIRKKLIGASDWNSPANRALIEGLLAENSD